LNHDYTEKDELKVSLFHLIHLLQCNHGSETNQQILNNEKLIFSAFLSQRSKNFGNIVVNILLFVWLGEPYVRFQTKTETKPTLEINIGENLMFALRTTNVCEPMTEGKRF